MQVREYRDAYRKYERIKSNIIDMENDYDFKVLALKQDIADAKKELEVNLQKAQKLARKLKAPFMTKVDSDMVFRLINNQSVQIVPITEE